ncbi:protein transferring glycosyl groups [Gossypium australe]|uniref:Protein transferring glycosyl groups n=1 Tax=Gossypium australe TaxID=47621 RepID=A0A5B6XD32_9ROSI|nr:protein transferring glycosyl groups [Gossypium australe]
MSCKNFLLYTTWLIIFINPSVEWPESNSITTPTPTPWPEQFHALLCMKLSSGVHQITDLWYDWPKGRNVNLLQKQLGVYMYDVEWNNGTSFYYTKGINGTCQTIEFGVGIPRPDFLDGANYLGTQVKDGFLCNMWEKVDFIWYYEDVATKRPVRWDFYDEMMRDID